MRSTPAARNENWRFDPGGFDQRLWQASLDQLPQHYDLVRASAGPSEVELWAPTVRYKFTSGIDELTFKVEGPDHVVGEYAELMVERLREAASLPGVLTGYVDVDRIADAYSKEVVAASMVAASGFDIQVHGYYWAVLLTEGHLERLGGVDALAGLEGVEVEAAGAGVLCRLDCSPLGKTEPLVRAWRQALKPVLRVGFPTNYDHHPSRNQPLWIFEGVRAPFAVAFLLRWAVPDQSVLGHDDDQHQHPVEWSDRRTTGDRQATLQVRVVDQGDVLDLAVAVVNAWAQFGTAGGIGTDPLPGQQIPAEAGRRMSDCRFLRSEAEPDGDTRVGWEVDFGELSVEFAMERLCLCLDTIARVQPALEIAISVLLVD
ncbi:MAG: hypothetical protein GY698_21905 [Actinomycetia bacterium]|nr:hypothetical protein [Actinomycetes bacterium]